MCADCCAPTAAHSSDRRPFPGRPTPRGPTGSPAFCFDGWSTSTGLADPVDWSVHQRSRKFLPSTPNRLLVDSSDLKQQSIGSPTHALRLERQVPTALVFVQPTQEEVDLIMSLSLRMGFGPHAR